MSDTFPAMEIDPRKVERMERYLRDYARLHALDPLEHQRRYLAGLLVKAKVRRHRSAASVTDITTARHRAHRSHR